jgi:hypothetical protein
LHDFLGYAYAAYHTAARIHANRLWIGLTNNVYFCILLGRRSVFNLESKSLCAFNVQASLLT